MEVIIADFLFWTSSTAGSGHSPTNRSLRSTCTHFGTLTYFFTPSPLANDDLSAFG